jgi:putative ABC transport system permease protein
MTPPDEVYQLGIASRAVRNIGRRKTRAALAIAAISISMAILVSIPAGLSASQSAVERLSDRMTVDYSSQVAEIEDTSSIIEVGNTGTGESGRSQSPTGAMGEQGSGSASTVNDSVMTTIQTIDGVEAVIPYISMTEGMPEREDLFGSTPPTSGGGPPTNGTIPDFSSMREMMSNVTKVLGVTLTDEAVNNYSVLPTTILSGRNLDITETGAVLLSENLSAYYGTEVGGTVTIMDEVFTVVGIYQNTTSMGNRTVFMNIADAQDIYGLGTNASYLYVYVEDPDMVSTIASAIEVAYSDVSVSTMADRLQQLTDLQAMSEQTLTSAATTLQQTENTANQEIVIAVAATGMIILFVMLFTVKERIKEIGVLKTLGFSKMAVIFQFILEGVVIAAIAGIVGAVVGWVGTSVLTSLLLPSSEGPSGGSGQIASLAIQPELTWVLAAFALVVAMGALGSMYPAWRASRTRPVEALKNE